MLSGRYPTDYLACHWTRKDGSCLLPSCIGVGVTGTLEHLLVSCPSLDAAHQTTLLLWGTYIQKGDIVSCILSTALADLPNLTQFLLDNTALPYVQHALTMYGPDLLQPLFYLTRTWCFNVHRSRYSTLGLWCFR